MYYFQFRRYSRLPVIPACPESAGHAATVRTDSGLASLARMTGINAVILGPGRALPLRPTQGFVCQDFSRPESDAYQQPKPMSHGGRAFTHTPFKNRWLSLVSPEDLLAHYRYIMGNPHKHHTAGLTESYPYGLVQERRDKGQDVYPDLQIRRNSMERPGFGRLVDDVYDLRQPLPCNHKPTEILFTKKDWVRENPEPGR